MYFSVKINLHLAGFIAVVVQSCRLRTFIRWQHDGTTRSSWSRVAIVRPTWFIRVDMVMSKLPDGNDGNTNAFPVTLRWWGWWYELNTNPQHRTHLRGFFNMLKNLEPFPKLSMKSRKSGRWFYNGERWHYK